MLIIASSVLLGTGARQGQFLADAAKESRLCVSKETLCILQT